MTKSVWLLEETLRAEHGRSEGLRNEGLLSSALARPMNLLAYGEPPPDLASLAAAYAYGIARDHPFVDGNKRTGGCSHVSQLNGVDLGATQDDKFFTFVNLAEGVISEEELAEWIRKRIQ